MAEFAQKPDRPTTKSFGDLSTTPWNPPYITGVIVVRAQAHRSAARFNYMAFGLRTPVERSGLPAAAKRRLSGIKPTQTRVVSRYGVMPLSFFARQCSARCAAPCVTVPG